MVWLFILHECTTGHHPTGAAHDQVVICSRPYSDISALIGAYDEKE